MDVIGWIVSPKEYVEDLTWNTSEYNLIWIQCCFICNSLKWGNSEVGCAFNPVWLVFLQEEKRHSDGGTQGNLWQQRQRLGDIAKELQG